MQIYGFGINPLDQFGSSANNFTIYDPEMGHSLDVREWSRVHGRPFKDFYARQAEILNNYSEAIFARNLTERGVKQLPFEDILRTYDSVNKEAVDQVLSSFGNWKSFTDIIQGKADPSSKTVYGFDLETFGDIQKGQGVFGITEIAIGRRTYDTLGQKGRLGVMADGASIAVGIKDQAQIDYLSGLISDFRQGKWNDMSQTDQVALRRLTRYAGRYEDIFGTTENLGIIPGKFTIVRGLSDEVISADAMTSGLNNLKRVGTNQSPGDVIKRFGEWLYNQADNENALFYGANSAFDFDGFANMMSSIGMEESMVSKVRSMKSGVLDTVYLMRAASTVGGQSVKGFTKDVTGEYVGATVDEQVRAFALAMEQSHFGFADIGNEGSLTDYYARNVFTSFFDDEKQLEGLYSDHNLGRTIFRIRNGQLNQSDGREFGFTPGFDKNKYGEIAHGMSIVGDSWIIDPKYSGQFIDKETGDQMYTAVFKNVADELLLDEENASRFVLTAKTVDELRNRVTEIAGNSDLYDLPGDVEDISKLGMDSPLGRSIIAAQEQRAADLGRREFAKFFSAADSRVDKGTITTGYNRLHDVLQFEQSLQDSIRSGSVSGSYFYPSSGKIASPTDKMAIEELVTFHDSYVKNGGKPILFSRTQAQTYLGMRSRIVDEEELLRTIDDTVAKAFQGQSGVGVDMQKTAIASRIYQAASDVLYENKSEYRWRPEILSVFDDNSIDLTFRTRPDGDMQYFRVNAITEATAIKDVRRFLRNNHLTLDEYNNMLGDLKRRNIISQDYKLAADTLEMDWFSGQDLGVAIHKGLQTNAPSFEERILHDITDEARASQLRAIMDPETGSPIPLGQLYRNSPEIREAIAQKASKIVDSSNRIQYITLEPGRVDSAITAAITGDNGLLKSTGMTRGGDSAYDKDLADMFTNMFYKEDKSYAIANRSGDGIQGFIISSDNAGKAMQEGQDSYLLLTNQKHAAALTGLVDDEDYLKKIIGSYNDMRNSEIAQHATIIPIPRIHKWRVGEGSGIAGIEPVISAVQQGDDFYKIISPELRTFIGDDGLMRVSFNDPAMQMASIYQKYGGRIIDYTLDGDFERGSRLYRIGFDGAIKDASSFTTRFGSDNKLHINMNEAMKGFEVRLHGGLTEIFNRLVLTPDIKDAGFNTDNFNPLQRLVMAFGEAKGMSPTQSEYKNIYYDYFKDILDDKDFQEVFHSRMVYGHINKDGYLGRFLPNTDEYDKNIYDLMRDVITSEKYKPLVDSLFVTNGTAFNIRKVFENLPSSSELDAIGSESAVKHGAYYLTKSGRFNPQSNLQNMMRPAYIQQNNAYVYDLKEMRAASGRLFKEASTSGSSPIYFGLNQMSTMELGVRTALNNANGIIVDESKFLGEVKTMGDFDLQSRYISLVEDGNVDDRIREFNRILSENGIDVTVTKGMYEKAVKAARHDLGYLYEDAAIISPALQDTPLFKSRDSISLQFTNTGMLDIDYTRSRLKQLSEIGEIRPDTVIGRTTNGRDIYFGKAPVRINEEKFAEQIEALLEGRKVKFDVADYGDIFNNKIYVNGMEKATTHTINYDTLLNRMGLNTAAIISQFKVGQDNIQSASRDLATYLFGQITDGAIVAGNFQYMKHGGIAGLKDAWNLIQSRYSAQAADNPDLGREFANRLNDVARSLNEKVEFTWNDEYRRLVANDSDFVRPTAFYEKLIEEEMESGFLSPDNEKLSPLMRSINADIRATYDRFKRLNIGLSDIQRQIMNEHMGTKFTIDQRIEQGLRHQGFHSSADIDKHIADNNNLVDAFKDASKRYTGYAPIVSGKGTPYNYDALTLIQKHVGVARGASRAKYNHDASEIERSLKGMTEAIDDFKRNVGSSEISGRNVVEVKLADLLDEVRRGAGAVDRDALMESIFFVDGEPSDYLKRLAQNKPEVDFEHGSYSIWVDTSGYKIAADNVSPIAGRANSNIRNKINGFSIPIFTANAIGNEETMVFQQSQHDAATLLSRMSKIILEQGDKSNDTIGIELGNEVREYIQKLNAQTDYLKKSSDAYKYAQTWTIPNSGQFLSQDQVAPALGLSTTEKFKVVLDGKEQEVTFRELYERKRDLETRIREASTKTDFIDEDKLVKQYQNNLDAYNKVLATLRKNLADDYKNRSSDLSVLEGVLKEAGISDILDLAQREVINGKVKNGLAVAISEEGFEQQLGLSIGDVAQSLVDEYERFGAREYLGSTSINGAPPADIVAGLTKKLTGFSNSFEMMEEFLGVKPDERLVEEGAAAKEQIKRQNRMLGKYLELRTELSRDSRTALDFAPNEYDLTKQLTNGEVQYVTIAEAANRRLRQLFIQEYADESSALSIRQLNERIADGSVIIDGMPKSIRDFYDAYQEIFKKSGIGQYYLQDVGVRGLLTRYPVFNLQPWVKVVLDPYLKGKEIRASNPVINKLIHLDNDGDQVMLGIIARGSTLMRVGTKDKEGRNILELHSKVYQDSLESFVGTVLEDAFSDDAPFKVNDVSNYAKQEASLLESIDSAGYKKALKEYLEGYAKANPREKGPNWVQTTMENIKNPENAAILEAFQNSNIIKKFYKENIGSTITNENVLISATVARIRKDYIGYVSTPNYKTREALNFAYRTIQKKITEATSFQDADVYKKQLQLLRKASLGFTSFENANGGLFSVIEQKIIDPKHARDGLSPIGVTKYSTALNSLMQSKGDSKKAFFAMNNIMSVIGPKALDIEDMKQAEMIAHVIVDTKDLKSYEELITALKNLPDNPGSKMEGISKYFREGVSYDLTKPYAKMLEAAKPFKALHEIVETVDGFGDIWENLIRKSSYDTIARYFSDFDQKSLEVFENTIHGLGLDGFLGLYLGKDSKSASLPPFKKGNMYFAIGTGYGDLGGETKSFVYQGQGLFYGVSKSGDIDKSIVLNTKSVAGFDNIGFENPISFETYRTNPVVKQQVTQQVNSYRIHKYLNELTIGENEKLRTVLPKPLSKTTAKVLNREASIDLVDIGDRVIGGRENWNSTYESINKSLKVYQTALGTEIPMANAPNSAAELLKSINEEISKQPYRDLSAISKDGASYYVEMVKSTVMKYLGGSQDVFDAVYERSQLLPEGFSPDSFRDQLANLSKKVYNVDNEVELYNSSLDSVAREYKRLKAAGASGKYVEALNELVQNRQTSIRDFISNVRNDNLTESKSVQESIIKMLSPDGTDIGKFKSYANQAFNWGSNAAFKDSMVGFGTFMGQRFSNLSVSDISIIRGEADSLIETATKSGEPLSEQLQYMINTTRTRLDGYVPTATTSALKKNTSRWLTEALGVHDSSIAEANRLFTDKERVKNLTEEAARRMRKQTISGSVFDKAKSLNITGKQVGIGIAAMAAIGLTNKLLHREKASPLEASRGPSTASPTINGRQEGSRPSAPPSAGTGSRTVYHDQQSGLNFKVSAQTKRRLENDSYGSIVGHAGGGGASVHIYNDTRGISDNWLSNKFSELSE